VTSSSLIVLGVLRLMVESSSSYVADPMRRISDSCSPHFRFGDLIACGETWHRLFPPGADIPVEYLPAQAETWDALASLCAAILEPVVAEFGGLHLTYGFAGPALSRHVPGRIAPKLDQHAAFECDRRGRRICPRGGAAVDFTVPDVDASRVLAAIRRLDFDRVYFYGDDRPIHVSWSATPVRHAVAMLPGPSGRRVPRLLRSDDQR
jgi:hypothetical protein